MKGVTMFGGKGGVGKSTCAGTTALHHAKKGRETLIISTDPTPSLNHLFNIQVRERPTKIREHLFLMEIGVEEIKAMWNKTFGEEVYEVFSSFVDIDYPEFVDFITTILPGLGEEFMVDYIRKIYEERIYEKIIWDTAPLGQTLGLLKMPGLLFEHLKAAPRIYSKLVLGKETRRPLLTILKDWERLSYRDTLFLREEVEFVMVTIPEALAIKQLDGVFQELREYQIPPSQLIINQVIKEKETGFLQKKKELQKTYLQKLYNEYRDLKIREIPAFSDEVRGLEMLERVRRVLYGAKES